ncbi:MAG TPA: MXAN_6521/LA_1396 family lipoprotein [Myxococcaceae bacterium]|nr:MXAN_6521/LA_1396 family lipoprotein [Myxococcaceae bacterium]
MTRTSRGMRILFAGAALLLLGSGCATVRASRIRPDYDQYDRQQTKRLVVVVQPLPDGNAKVGELWATVARRYVNQKRDFIAKESRAVAGAPVDPRSHCAEGLEGVLWLTPRMEKKGEGFEALANGILIRCSDGQEVWSGEAGGSWRSQDPQLTEVTAVYVSELGPEVEPYVPPTLNLLRPLLDTLPFPELTTDAEKDEKIELGE